MKHIIYISVILFAVITGEAAAKEATTKEKEAAAKEAKKKDKEIQAMVKRAMAKEPTAKKKEATAKKKEATATAKEMEATMKEMDEITKKMEQQEPLGPLVVPEVTQADDSVGNKGGNKGLHKSLTVEPAAVASCGTGTRIQGVGQNSLQQLLGGMTVCKMNAANTDWEWQEFHDAPEGRPNNLIDYKKGPNDPVDPTSPVGSWSINTVNPPGGGNDRTQTVTYNYGGTSIYTFSVWAQGPGGTGPYNFCSEQGERDVLNATLINGQGPC
jgi:hypothetical protein